MIAPMSGGAGKTMRLRPRGARLRVSRDRRSLFRAFRGFRELSARTDFAWQKVLSTIATSLGDAGLNVTELGSGEQVMVGFVVVHANCTVPVNPGSGVRTNPNATLPPGATVGTVG